MSNAYLYNPFLDDDLHGDLPYVRITEVELQNFKSVEHGIVTFACAKKKVPYNTKSDILAIYGQNGSGKTALVDALDIIRSLLMGEEIPFTYDNCISVGKEWAAIGISFDFQYPDGKVRKIKYSFKLSATEGETMDTRIKMSIDDQDINFGDFRKINQRLHVYDEVVSVSGDFDGKKVKMQPIIDTSISNTMHDFPFGPSSKIKCFLNNKELNSSGVITKLNYNKMDAFKYSKSFIFMDETMKILKECGSYSSYYQILVELYHFGNFFFKIIGAQLNGMIRFNVSLPIYTRYGLMLVGNEGVTKYSNRTCDTLENIIENIDLVISQIVPGMHIAMKRLGPSLLKDGSMGQVIDMVSIRNGMELPIRNESDGLRKLISAMSLIIDAFNQPSTTIVIDELDAGVFEYLLGELLELFEKYGKGQFVFTSHNLRPLEVLNKDCLVFTTTNPNNRYIRLKGVGHSNNPRNRYLHDILMGNQDEDLYSQAKAYKIVQAFRKADIDA